MSDPISKKKKYQAMQKHTQEENITFKRIKQERGGLKNK